MAGSAEKSDNTKESVTSQAVEDFVKMLSPEQRMLIVLKAQFYDGRWEHMLEDLKNRLEGKPYIFKLQSRIKDDIQRIEQMQNFEKEYNMDLADYVDSVD